MDDKDRDAFEDLQKTVNSIATDVGIIKATQPNLAETIKSFTTLYTTLDTRVRTMEISGHDCKNKKDIETLKGFMQQHSGERKGAAPFFDYMKQLSYMVISCMMGILVAMVGLGGNK